MSYLKHLENIYSKNQIDNLKDILESDCKSRILKEIFDVDIAKIKKYIEDHIEEQIFFADVDDSHVEINICEVLLKKGITEITDYFTDKAYKSLFKKYIKSDDDEGMEVFIETLAPFQAIKDELEKELDGLEFNFNLTVTIHHKKIHCIEVDPSVSFSIEGFNRYLESDSE